nr:hypothetical protein [Corynebacterium lactis]
MGKRILSSFLLAALPLSGVLAGCSTTDKSAEVTGGNSVAATSPQSPDQRLPHQADDAAIRKDSTTSEAPSASGHSHSNGGPSPAQSATQDPYLPPRAYIPNGPATSNPLPEASPSSSSASQEAQAPVPSKPVPVVPTLDSKPVPGDGNRPELAKPSTEPKATEEQKMEVIPKAPSNTEVTEPQAGGDLKDPLAPSAPMSTEAARPQPMRPQSLNPSGPSSTSQTEPDGQSPATATTQSSPGAAADNKAPSDNKDSAGSIFSNFAKFFRF